MYIANQISNSTCLSYADFEITARQTLFIVRSRLNFVYISALRTNTELKTLKPDIENYRVANFSDLPIKCRVTTHIDLE